MKPGVFKHIEETLRDYPNTDAYVKERRQELLHPYNASPDENIGGGRSNVPAKQLEDLAISIAEDRRLTNLERNKRVVKSCLQVVDQDTVDLITELYFKKHQTRTLEGIAQKLNSSPAAISRKRTKFFELVKSELGW